MLPSRGMGAISPSKMPSSKKVKRKDNPNTVDVYKEGGPIPLPPKKSAKK
jgi:hypothetical protein